MWIRDPSNPKFGLDWTGHLNPILGETRPQN